MKGILIFVVTVVWGSLSGQFLVQVVTSFVVTAVSIAGIIFSKVSKGINFRRGASQLCASNYVRGFICWWQPGY